MQLFSASGIVHILASALAAAHVAYANIRQCYVACCCSCCLSCESEIILLESLVVHIALRGITSFGAVYVNVFGELAGSITYI